MELAYWLEGSGVPLLLIHGYPFDKRLWQPLLPHLRENCRLIVPDLPGFGESPLPDKPLTLDDMADALAELLDELGFEKALVAGHSMGGYIAFAFARRHFQRLLGLGLIATHPAADPPPKRAQRARQARDIVESGSTATLAAQMPALLTPDTQWHTFIADLIREQKPAAVAMALHAMAIRDDAFGTLSALRGLPVALVSGEADAIVPPDLYARMKAGLPHAHEARFADAGHMPMLTHPQETSAALKAICPSK